MFTYLYVASVVSRIILRKGFAVQAKNRALEEGYTIEKINRSLTDKVGRFVKEIFLTFCPFVNTISALHFYGRSFDKYYKKVIENGLPYGINKKRNPKFNSNPYCKFEKNISNDFDNFQNDNINKDSLSEMQSLKNRKIELLKAEKAKAESLKEQENMHLINTNNNDNSLSEMQSLKNRKIELLKAEKAKAESLKEQEKKLNMVQH